VQIVFRICESMARKGWRCERSLIQFASNVRMSLGARNNASASSAATRSRDSRGDKLAVSSISIFLSGSHRASFLAGWLERVKVSGKIAHSVSSEDLISHCTCGASTAIPDDEWHRHSDVHGHALYRARAISGITGII